MISSVLNIARSGLDVADLQLRVSAHNVANANTDGFEASRVASQSIGTGGVTGLVVPTDVPPPQLYRYGSSEPIAGSNTDLISETINRILAVHAYKANISTIRTADEMAGALLKTIA